MGGSVAWLRVRTKVEGMHTHRAQAVVEFALIAPVLVLLTLGILGFGRAFYTYIDLTNAARAGARLALTKPALCAADTAFKSQVKSIQPNIDWSPAAVSIDLACTNVNG